MDTQLYCSHVLFQPINYNLVRVNQARNYLGKRLELSDQVFIFKTMKDQLSDDKFVIVP